MNEFDEADFQGFYSGSALIKNVEIKKIPWDIGRVQEVVKQSTENMSINKLLDVGCGMGDNSEYFGSKEIEVTAVDFSEEAIQKARTRHQNPRVNYIHKDILEYEETWKEKYDTVLDSATYHAIPTKKRQQYLKNLYTYLQPDGKLVTITFAIHPKGMPKNLSVEEQTLHDSLREAGFNNIEIKLGVYYGVYSAISSMVKDYDLKIEHTKNGESILPVWVAISSKEK
ncbi:class I SAM-dependent methyltransferase [Microbacterium foliorum]|uniref:class I SAM-dependent methyltransferase n=1 Tax=Rothia terrae TaxID=396015 RepID=UPI0034198686